MNRFLNSEISIKVNTKKELTEFLELCEKYHLKWQEGEKPTEWSPLGRFRSCGHGRSCKITLPIIIGCNGKRIGYSEDRFIDLMFNESEIVEYQDFKDSEELKKYD